MPHSLRTRSATGVSSGSKWSHSTPHIASAAPSGRSHTKKRASRSSRPPDGAYGDPGRGAYGDPGRSVAPSRVSSSSPNPRRLRATSWASRSNTRLARAEVSARSPRSAAAAAASASDGHASIAVTAAHASARQRDVSFSFSFSFPPPFMKKPSAGGSRRRPGPRETASAGRASYVSRSASARRPAVVPGTVPGSPSSATPRARRSAALAVSASRARVLRVNVAASTSIPKPMRVAHKCAASGSGAVARNTSIRHANAARRAASAAPRASASACASRPRASAPLRSLPASRNTSKTCSRTSSRTRRATASGLWPVTAQERHAHAAARTDSDGNSAPARNVSARGDGRGWVWFHPALTYPGLENVTHAAGEVIASRSTPQWRASASITSSASTRPSSGSRAGKRFPPRTWGAAPSAPSAAAAAPAAPSASAVAAAAFPARSEASAAALPASARATNAAAASSAASLVSSVYFLAAGKSRAPPRESRVRGGAFFSAASRSAIAAIPGAGARPGAGADTRNDDGTKSPPWTSTRRSAARSRSRRTEPRRRVFFFFSEF